MAMKVLGVLFLLWIAFQTFRHAADPIALDGAKDEAVAHPFMKGFLTQISNPKVAVFFGSIFIAMLPTNVPLWMTVALVVIVTCNEVWWYSVVALFFGSGRVRQFYISTKKWIDRLTGLFLGALGLRLLWAAREAA